MNPSQCALYFSPAASRRACPRFEEWLHDFVGSPSIPGGWRGAIARIFGTFWIDQWHCQGPRHKCQTAPVDPSRDALRSHPFPGLTVDGQPRRALAGERGKTESGENWGVRYGCGRELRSWGITLL